MSRPSSVDVLFVIACVLALLACLSLVSDGWSWDHTSNSRSKKGGGSVQGGSGFGSDLSAVPASGPGSGPSSGPSSGPTQPQTTPLQSTLLKLMNTIQPSLVPAMRDTSRRSPIDSEVSANVNTARTFLKAPFVTGKAIREVRKLHPQLPAATVSEAIKQFKSARRDDVEGLKRTLTAGGPAAMQALTKRAV